MQYMRYIKGMLSLAGCTDIATVGDKRVCAVSMMWWVPAAA
jgi:hypothetical protein